MFHKSMRSREYSVCLRTFRPKKSLLTEVNFWFFCLRVSIIVNFVSLSVTNNLQMVHGPGHDSFTEDK